MVLIEKDLRLLLRDRLALALMFLAPVLVITAAGLSLSSLYSTRTHLFPVVDLDGGSIARRFVEALGESSQLEVIEVEAEEAKRLVAETPRAGAALLIPENFSSDEGSLTLWIDPVKHLEVLEVRAAVERARAGLVTSRVTARIAVVEVLTYATEEVDLEALGEDAAELAGRLAEKTVPLGQESVYGGPTGFNTFDQNVPGFSLTFLLLGMLFGVGLGLVDEREWGTLRRLASGPVSPAKLVLGKMLSRFLLGVCQMIVLFFIGYVAFDISLGPSLPALMLVVVAVTFASASVGLLAAAVAPSRDAVLPMGTIAVVAMAAIGGCWWPITIEPIWLQQVAHIFPTAWAMNAFNDLMLRQRAWTDVLPGVLALFAFGVAYASIGALVMRRSSIV